MVRKEIWGHLLLYNLIRGVMAEAARRHGLIPRELGLQGARQTVAGFRADVARADDELAASHRVGHRPDRVEPRVVKRRPKAYPRMQESRQTFKRRKRLVPAA
jgi:hypothetical protein